jgi:hypothetical protein
VQSDGKGYSAPTAACIDAETLAAWADGGLPKAEAAAVEVHLADCERCTSMVATFVRTTPESPAAESLWQRWHLRWLVPLATAATVAALWVLVPRPGSGPAGTPESAVTTEAPAAAPSPQQPSLSAEAKREEPAAVTAPTAPADAFARRDEKTTVEPRLAERERALDETRERAGLSVADARPAPAPVAPAAPPPAREADRADQANQNLSRQEEAAAAPAPTATARSAPAPASPLGEARRQSNTAFAAVVAQLQVVSPDPMTRWRVIGAGQVERSTNGGAQWVRATLPESATLTGGVSPAPSICWLVGRTGAIYVTTDGLRFSKVPSPDRTDFISIQALDARRATVVTSDGRRMQTEDQGLTWSRIAP